MPGSNLAHSAASTPPLVIGISTDSPERLSVMVTVSGTTSPYRLRRGGAPGRVPDSSGGMQAGLVRSDLRHDLQQHLAEGAGRGGREAASAMDQADRALGDAVDRHDVPA